MNFHEPTTLEEAAALLAADEDARPLAGGATLVAMMNAELVEPTALVSLRRIAALDGITASGDGTVTIGAMTTHHALANTDSLDGGQAIVRHAARVIGHPAIRNMGTIGGAVAHADPAADYPAALVAAGATIEAFGPGGTRDIGADDFFIDYLETALAPGELVSAVRLPASPQGATSAYEKFARVDGDFATLSVAVVMAMDAGACSHVRVALGSAGPTPVRAQAADAALAGTALDDAAISAAAEILVAACDPLDDVRGSAEYRLMLVPELLKRAIRRAQETRS
jgi:carbon-monoxide dehydrogenase medium subunit